jgi:mono/diheme cytochrome c family protein
MKTIILNLIIAYTGFLVQDFNLADSINRGEVIYDQVCVYCHKPDGKGLPYLYPPLSGSDFLLEKTDQAIRIIKSGYEGVIEVNGVKYSNMMPDHGLSDQEVADVVNYILRNWDNQKNDIITSEKVRRIVADGPN